MLQAFQSHQILSRHRSGNTLASLSCVVENSWYPKLKTEDLSQQRRGKNTLSSKSTIYRQKNNKVRRVQFYVVPTLPTTPLPSFNPWRDKLRVFCIPSATTLNLPWVTSAGENPCTSTVRATLCLHFSQSSG